MIRAVGDGFVISSGRAWLPGVYDSERAAKYAFRFPGEVLQRLQDSVNPGGAITFQMLQDARAPSGAAKAPSAVSAPIGPLS